MSKYRGNPWAVLIVVSLGFFMTLLDLTIVNIAIPNMIDKLHASLDGILWVINAYALVLAVLLITAGRLGDLKGQRALFIVGVALFTAASAACGFSPTVGWLIGFRAVQGVGAALLMPQTLALLTMVFPPERRGAAFGVWGAVAGVATIAGPTLGGLLVTAFDWRYIFFINLPIGIAVILLGIFLIPDLRTGTQHKLDLTGVVLASLALLAICYGLVEGQKYNWGTITSFISIPLVIGLGIALLIVFLIVQAKTQDKEPLVPFALFRDRNFSLMNWMSGALSIGLLGIFLPITIYFQSALGYSALKAGLVMAPSSVVSMFVAPAAGRLTDKIGGKFILFTGLTLFAGGMGWLAAIAEPTSNWPIFVPALVISGFGLGCTFAPLTTTAMQSVQPRLAGAASGMINTTRQVGSVIGAAAVGALLENRLTATLPAAVRARDAVLPPTARAHLVAGFAKSAQSGAAVGTGSSGFKLPPGTPASLADEIGRIAREAFSFGYVSAMHQAMIMPIAVVGLTALSALAIKRMPTRSHPAQAQPAPAASQAGASQAEASQAPA
ncbi:MAG TPA: DHA2 family efflux MFS transporter permease subunit [Streptosporangiaceae bacterium]|nr:DHA2 family efflux MFS transporter permease subunit [Streptosporangiaceae bacterium]